MIFSQFLSMPLKRFDSCGSCLAMSPEVKTASRYIHIACTCTHCSRISETVDSLVIHACTSSLNGLDVPRRHHRAQVHLRLLEPLHQLGRLAALELDRPAALEVGEGELRIGPVGPMIVRSFSSI